MTEEQLHRSVADFLRVALPENSFFTSVQPGGSSLALNAKRKALGVVAGVPDFLIWFEGHSIGIELKTATGRVSASQRDTLARMHWAGVKIFICRSLNDVEAALRMFGVPLRARTS